MCEAREGSETRIDDDRIGDTVTQTTIIIVSKYTR